MTSEGRESITLVPDLFLCLDCKIIKAISGVFCQMLSNSFKNSERKKEGKSETHTLVLHKPQRRDTQPSHLHLCALLTPHTHTHNTPTFTNTTSSQLKKHQANQRHDSNKYSLETKNNLNKTKSSHNNKKYWKKSQIFRNV